MRSTSWQAHILGTVLGAFLSLTPAVHAAQELPPIFQSFEGIDADGDGFISLEEAREVHIRFFAVLDENRDDSLTTVEFLSKRIGPAEFGFGGPRLYDTLEKLFSAWNVNGDKKLSKAEFIAGGLTGFARADRNGDSRLSKAEYEASLR
ncbi:MAG: EF-hand domain-containing protein [Thiobacillus sp.]|jgi:Ca2+-binding EF-hand superfamily protein|uniref:EF-hand domain-containing protein n=1 Tax=Thiobacillus sp. TaxID=924 RepID=UPI002895BB4C|nr:EF-hand domain-containing protein [Thiobacillus sp.]MDT3705331.1 EF-hand domain-containing protein [Thiobacillus sp.]